MTREDVLINLRKHKPELQLKYHVANLSLFGSYARGDETPESDVDLLVEFSAPVGIEFVDLLIELENILHTKVDLVSKKALKPHYRNSIEEDLILV